LSVRSRRTLASAWLPKPIISTAARAFGSPRRLRPSFKSPLCSFSIWLICLMLRQKGSDSPEIPQVLPEMQLSASDRREPAAVEQPIGDLEVGDLVGQLQCFGPEPPHADHGDQYARQDAANCGVGLEVLAFHAAPAVNSAAEFFCEHHGAYFFADSAVRSAPSDSAFCSRMVMPLRFE
jgi:hypothetical protein